MRSFHKDYTLHFNVYTHFISPTLRWRRVFLCDEEMWCHSLWLSVSGVTQQIMLMCFVVVVVCIMMLHRVIIICNNCPICNAGARARLAAKWYWPIAPNSTRLTRTHHLSPGYWLQNIFMFNSKLKYLRTFWTKSISLHEWNMLIVIAITRVLCYQEPRRCGDALIDI